MKNTDYEIRGFYKPSFFSLYIDGEYKEEHDQMYTEDLGTFVHEYIHYLQNITTIFGLQNSLFYFQYLFEIRKYINQQVNIDIPIKNIPFSQEVQNGIMLFDFYCGTKKSLTPVYGNIEIEVIDNSREHTTIKTVCLKLYFQGKVIENIKVGNTCIKESMARLYQLLFDENVDHPTFPYKTAEILSELINPEILSDKRKLITICLFALNSQNGGFTFYELLMKSKQDSQLNGIIFYFKYLNEYKIVSSGKEKTIHDFLLTSIDSFKSKLSVMLLAKQTHFSKLLSNVQLSIEEKMLPLISILYQDELSLSQKLYAIIDFYGIPHIRTRSGFNYFPWDTEKNKLAEEFVELLGQNAVFERILEIDYDKRGTFCSLLPTCQNSEDELIDENCYGTQWLRTQVCPFTIISGKWKLKQKITTGNMPG